MLKCKPSPTPRIGAILLTFAAAAPAAAQDNAVSSAVDAFGERVGTEQSGLYTESQVRGFNLNDSGAYRIDGAYFSRAAPLDDTILAGVGVRVGVNATRLAYPAPSGVVNYRLREPGPLDELRLSAGLRDFGTPTLQADGSLRRGMLGIAGGVVWRPLWRLPRGEEGYAVNLGLVAGLEMAPDQRFRAFGSVNPRGYDGDYTVVPAEAAMPPSLPARRQYSPRWARSSAVSTNIGAIYDGVVGGFTVDASLFRSVFRLNQVDYTVIAADSAGDASATTFRIPTRTTTADSAEARIGRQFEAAGLSHLVTLSLRGERRVAGLTSTFAIPLGSFQLPDRPPDVPEAAWSGTRGRDRVEQTIASVGYGLAWSDRIQLRFGLHRSRYSKSVLSTAGVRTEGTDESIHHNASAVVSLSGRTAVFGSWVTGLEESGVAPTTATNRDEVLPPVNAEQFELGIRHSITPGLTVIGAVFQVSKPTQGFRADGSFGLVGEVRHRGFEGSIAGRLDESTRAVIGLVAFTSAVTGPLVDAGIVGPRAAGISQRVVNANVERRLGGGWSVDAGLSHFGERWANTANSFKAPAVTTLSLGARGRFRLAGRPAELRMLASNLAGAEGYLVAPSGLLSSIPPRTVRAILTVPLGARD